MVHRWKCSGNIGWKCRLYGGVDIDIEEFKEHETFVRKYFNADVTGPPVEENGPETRV